MQTIYKYHLPVADEAPLELPAGAKILHIDEQGFGPHMLQVWALVDTEEDPENRRLYVRGTGHPMTGEEGDHLATVLTRSGLVWHVFDDGAGVRA